MKGIKPWNYQRKFSYKPRPSMKGHIPWNKNTKGLMSEPWNKNKVGIMKGKMPTGEKHWNWKGGVRPLRKDVQVSKEYKDWRHSVYRRDNYTCVLCGARGVRLNPDHIKPFSEIIFENKVTTLEEALACKQLWDVSNGRTLCEPCHKQTDTFGLKQVRRLKFI